MTLSLPLQWLLVMIATTKYVEGDTRLQKYGLLIYKKIPEIEFFDDWKPWLYGVFSPGLNRGLKVLKKEELIKVNRVDKGYQKPVNRYTASEEALQIISPLQKGKSDIVKRISTIIEYYSSKTLKELLADVYLMYPEYTDNSTIKAEVNKEKNKLTPYLSPEFEIPYDDDKKLEGILSELVINVDHPEHMFNDDDERERLSKLIGLDSIPRLDPKSFDRLAGMFRDKIKSKRLDSVELVRSFRGSE